MKVVILAGGLGTRLSEETDLKPKPMVEVGGKPILWHIMKIYSSFGFHDFVICLGYKSYIVKEYFANYYLHQSDLTIDIKQNQIEWLGSTAEPWRVTLKDTGLNTMTGGRIKAVGSLVGNETFMLTYGDGVGNINIEALLKFHKSHGRLCTLTSVQPTGRFGALITDDHGVVKSFHEKPSGDGAWINGGFFVCEPGVLKYIGGNETVWERDPLENLAKDKQLVAYRHAGFWKPMDTLRDRFELDEEWKAGKARWKSW